MSSVLSSAGIMTGVLRFNLVRSHVDVSFST